jgi:hypothetical protein
VSDEFIVPVCRIHHRELHRSRPRAGRSSTSIRFQWCCGSGSKRRTDNEVVAPKEEVASAQAANTAGVSAQGQAATSDAQPTYFESDFRKNVNRLDGGR